MVDYYIQIIIDYQILKFDIVWEILRKEVTVALNEYCMMDTKKCCPLGVKDTMFVL